MIIGFVLLAAILIGSALFVVTSSRPVHGIVALLLNFIALAVFYVHLNAEFLAVTQILVYSGAILVLFVFVIALLSSGVDRLHLTVDRLARLPIPSIALLAALFGLFLWALMGHRFLEPSFHAMAVGGTPAGIADAFGSVGSFGTALFTAHVLPFEVTALILVVAIVGVVALTNEESRR